MYQAFQAHRLSEAEFAEQGSLLIQRPNLMCRLADRVFPWHQAAPVVMGVLAFGGDWQHLLPADGGVPIAVPALDTQASQQNARKVSYPCIVLLELLATRSYEHSVLKSDAGSSTWVMSPFLIKTVMTTYSNRRCVLCISTIASSYRDGETRLALHVSSSPSAGRHSSFVIISATWRSCT